MSDSENRKSGPQFSAAPLITSAAMVGAGTLIVLAGLAVGSGHLALVFHEAWLLSGAPKRKNAPELG